MTNFFSAHSSVWTSLSMSMLSRLEGFIAQAYEQRLSLFSASLFVFWEWFQLCSSWKFKKSNEFRKRRQELAIWSIEMVKYVSWKSSFTAFAVCFLWFRWSPCCFETYVTPEQQGMDPHTLWINLPTFSKTTILQSFFYLQQWPAAMNCPLLALSRVPHARRGYVTSVMLTDTIGNDAYIVIEWEQTRDEYTAEENTWMAWKQPLSF